MNSSFAKQTGKGDLHLKLLNTKDDPFGLFCKLYQFHERLFILESLVGPRKLTEFSIVGFDPDLVVSCDSFKLYVRNSKNKIVRTEDLINPLAQLRRFVPKVKNNRFRYVGGAVGFISYDAIRYWERISSKHRVKNYPLLEFGIYTDGILYDHQKNNAHYFTTGKSRFDEIKDEVEAANPVQLKNFSCSSPTTALSRKEYVNMVKKAKRYIYDGDIFQVVLSKNTNFTVNGDLLPVYGKLRELNPSPYMYFLKLGDMAIIGSSPEMLVRVTAKHVETFPIAGTRPVVKNEIKNNILAKELLADEKEVAEHTMLVDLARNDLGRVCKYGTVKVPELMSIKRFSHVQHIVSHVEGYLAPKFTSYDALKAVFPAGTVSGAPKVRAMEIIDELEPHERGLYAGAIGYFSANGSCDFAITIRSLIVKGHKASIQSGAGIVIDSVPEKEWKESEDKAHGVILSLKEASKGLRRGRNLSVYS
ncbi:MAG: anthranilate synthase component I family protein [Nitrososphaeraceae archaeon]